MFYTEKTELLLGNARLSQDLETSKRRSNDQVRDLREEVQQKNNSIAGLEQVLQEMTTEITSAKEQVTTSALLLSPRIHCSLFRFRICNVSKLWRSAKSSRPK